MTVAHDLRLCGCRTTVCPLWQRVVVAVRQNDEDGPGYRALKAARSTWLDHVLARQHALEAVERVAA